MIRRGEGAMELPFADDRTLILHLGFSCNNRCSHCIAAVEREANAGRWLAFEAMEARLRQAAVQKKLRKLIVSGGEPTLYPRLPEVIALGKSLGLAVQLQTNGRRLADPAYARVLFESGVDEFFLTFQGPDAAIHDALTLAEGSFVETTAAVGHVLALGGRLIVNTVIAEGNYRELPRVASYTTGLGARDVHYWFIVPDRYDATAPVVPRVSDVAPWLCRAIETAEAAGARATVKFFPACLLGPYGSRVDNAFPFDALASDEYNRITSTCSRYTCPHAAACPEFPRCWGLSAEYVKVRGTDEVRPPRAAAVRP
jgi:MoaA/NifB/PqqE/SkfB family radical SAM enzyme